MALVHLEVHLIINMIVALGGAIMAHAGDWPVLYT